MYVILPLQMSHFDGELYLPCGPKMDSLVYFDDNFGKYGPILIIFFTIVTRNLWSTKIKSFQPPHLYYVATSPSETNTDAGINANFSGSCIKTN